MKKITFSIFAILIATSCLFAQSNKAVTIKAGTKIKDYFPVSERYLYNDFTDGKAILKNEIIIPTRYNYNILSGEMEYIKLNDTLFITNKSDLTSIVTDLDTFYYHNGYLQQIKNGRIKVYLKQSIELKDILKKGAMGSVNRSAASESYDYLLSNSLSRDLVADIDMVLQKEEAYFFSVSGDEIMPFNKKNISKTIPGKKELIKNYITSNNVDFKSREDLLNLADYVSKL
jgi:hypothetical protein